MTGRARWNFASTDVQGVRDWLQANATKQQAEIQAKMVKELSLMKQSSVTVVVSTTEQQLLRQLTPGARIHVISNVHDAHVSSKPPEGCADRRGILFVGNFNHPPNQQAILALLDDILPETGNIIKPAEKDEFVLHIVGSNRGIDTDLGRTTFKIQFHGWLSDVELMILYRSVKLVVAPLMSGAGVKGKINQVGFVRTARAERQRQQLQRVLE
jgi:glycosyltransferase involved in cell wall biosynthesis